VVFNKRKIAVVGHNDEMEIGGIRASSDKCL